MPISHIEVESNCGYPVRRNIVQSVIAYKYKIHHWIIDKVSNSSDQHYDIAY